MDLFYLGIVAFLIVLAIFDLVVGVSNDAVNFLNSAIGAKVARFRTIVLIASIGVFAGAALSNGMMDVARHGIMTPEYFTFHDVMCVFLAVMVTDVILLDIFNSLGMPTSTTVSMVFELLGGAFAIAIIHIVAGATMPDGTPLMLGDMLNAEKALSVILAIFLSVAIAFVFGTIVQWIARIVFSFTYRINGTTTSSDGAMGRLTTSSLKIGIFSGIAITGIIWFLLIKGLKSTTFMTPDVKAIIDANTWYIIFGGIAGFSVIMTVLSAFKMPVLKFVVLLGTFALAMAFAGNDLVNFVGVPLTGLESYHDYMTNGNGDPNAFYMTSLMETANTPVIFLIAAGVIMVLSLCFSKKAQNVVKTSVDLSRQDEGDEMFGSSAVARFLVRSSSYLSSVVSCALPQPAMRWINSRFNSDAALLPSGAAFDHIRAAVNLVLAGLLVALGTSLKLPLSTTYVTFMVAMGTSLADRAWGRESAVFRITGVISVIGGWFITAGVAFVACYIITNIMYFGSFIAMAIAVAVSVFLIVRSNLKYKEKKTEKPADIIFSDILRSRNPEESWKLLNRHLAECNCNHLLFCIRAYETITESFFHEEYRPLKRISVDIDENKKLIKRQRRRHIIGLRRIDPIRAIERNTWFFLMINAAQQMQYCLKRLSDTCREHVGNNFSPVSGEYVSAFTDMRNEVEKLYKRTSQMMAANTTEGAETIRIDANTLQLTLSRLRKRIIDDIQKYQLNIETMTLFLNIIQESSEMLSALRHLVRGYVKFSEKKTTK